MLIHTKLCAVLLIIFCFYPVLHTVKKSAKEPKEDKCDICWGIFRQFEKNLLLTEKDNYGGGNTNWEERRLGVWQHSEIRLMQIVDNLCKNYTHDNSVFECHRLVEFFEEPIEDWWKGRALKDMNSHVELAKELCVEKHKLCCPAGHYGPECLRCHGFVEDSTDQDEITLCSNHGNCDGGSKRSGNGTCICHSGYSGQLCNECASNYFDINTLNTGKIAGAEHTLECRECDPSCGGSCLGPGSSNCSHCGEGYVQKNDSCVDIDECKFQGETSLCNASQYCLNSPGSFQCLPCNISCSSCIGGSARDCVDCSVGYENVTMDDGGSLCRDVDECHVNAALCAGNHETCSNLPGSYECRCLKGFVRSEDDDGECRLAAAEPETKTSATTATTNRPSSSNPKRPTSFAEGRLGHNNNNNNKINSNDKGKGPSTKKKTKIIWTVPFALEMLKLFVVCCIGLCFCAYVSNRIYVVMAVGLGLSYFVYHTSINLDSIYQKQ